MEMTNQSFSLQIRTLRQRNTKRTTQGNNVKDIRDQNFDYHISEPNVTHDFAKVKWILQNRQDMISSIRDANNMLWELKPKSRSVLFREVI